MERNLASRDLSDMMVYEGMDKQSRKFELSQHLAPLQKVMDAVYRALSSLFRRKEAREHSLALQFEEPDFSNTATVIYAISIASVLISFFWLTLLLSPTL